MAYLRPAVPADCGNTNSSGPTSSPSNHDSPYLPLSLCSISQRELARASSLDIDVLEDAYPATPLQEALMTVNIRQPGAFTTHEVYRLMPHADGDRIRRAITHVSETFQILRTRLVQTSSENVFQVVVKGNVPWTFSDSLEDFKAQDQARPLSYGSPLWRFAFVNDKQSGDSYLCWTAHHAGYDGWLENLLLAAVRSSYENGSFATPLAFVHFVRYFKSVDSAASKAFWAAQLAGERPTAYPDLPSTDYKGHVTREISRQTKFSMPRHLGVLASSFLRAAWAIAISLYSDSDDVIFATTLAGRQAPIEGIETAAGPTIATVPIRIAIDTSLSIADFLSKVHSQAVEMIPHEQYGLQHISRISPKVRAAMALHSYFMVQPSHRGGENSDAAAMGLERMPGSGEGFSADAYPFSVQCHLEGDHVLIDTAFDESMFETKQVELMMDQFSSVIEALSTQAASTRIRDLRLVSQTQFDAMAMLNGSYPSTVSACVHEVIGERTRECPDAPAVCSLDGDLTYAELEDKAARFAAHLISRSLVKECPSPVAVCMDKGAAAVVVMLAILKAGGTVACFNASQPQQRLKALITSLGANVVLASPQYTHLFENVADHVVSTSMAQIMELTEGRLMQTTVRPSDPAFVVYTSGSTGLPKAILLEHQSIVTSSGAHGRAMGIERGQRVLQFASFLYDVYIQDVFTTLQRGATICVVSEDERFNNLTAAINRTRATWSDLTSTVAATLDPTAVPTLKTIALGGEPMKLEVSSKWEKLDGMEVINVYGPAECSVTSMCSTMAQRRGQPSNIGHPVGCWAWIVDPRNRNLLRPIGTVGEMLIEGPILARHYLNEPEKTGAAFLYDLDWMREYHNPCDPGASPRRVYATGDLVKLQHDGTILYIGRTDNQIKINGMRVELEEVESSIIKASKGTAGVACELIKTPSGRKTLTAFVRMHEAIHPGTRHSKSNLLALTGRTKDALTRLEKELRKSVPSHMVPSLYLPLRFLPKSPSGKLDRKALRSLAESLSDTSISHYALQHVAVEAPETPDQFRLREIWSSVLNVPKTQIGASSNFFGVGGDSIGAMQLVPRAQAQGIRISVEQIYRNPTLRKMAEVATQDSFVSDSDIARLSLLPEALRQVILNEAESQCDLPQHIIEDIYPSTRLQEGLLAETAMDPRAYVNRMVYKITAHLDLRAYQQAWAKVIQSHSSLRTRLFMSTALERHVQVVVRGEIKWHEKINLQQYIADDELKPFEPGSCLARFAVISESEEQYIVITLHHAIFDGWSFGLLEDDVLNAYNGSPLVNKGDFRHFISFLEAQPVSEQEHYWKAHLGDESMSSWPQQANSTSVNTDPKTLYKQVAASEFQRHGVRPALVLRAAWALTTALYSGNDDVLMAVTLSGRDLPVPDALRLTAPLLTTVPLKIKIDRDQTVEQYLNQIEAQATEMIRFQHFGLQNVMSLQKARGLPLSLNQHFQIQSGTRHGQDEGPKLGLEHVDATSGINETYPLNASVLLDDSEASIEVVFDAATISPFLAERLVDQYVYLVNVLARSTGDMRISDLTLASNQDKEWILSLNKHVPERLNKCVHERVEEQVRLRPNAPAIASFDRDWSYAQLNEASDHLSKKLRKSGVGPESKVPLCFDKSSWAIVAMLATLKAGGACTSISPTYPRDRIAFIVEDTQARVVLCSPQHVNLFDCMTAGHGPLTVHGVDEPFVAACSDIQYDGISELGQQNAAFVVYTSGSTGQPKGVVVEHGAMSSSAAAHGPALGFSPSSRTAQFAAYTFDVSIEDIFTTLQEGGCVCVISEEERMSDLAGAINRRQANRVDMTPTVANILSPSQVPCIETLSLGGEALTGQAVSKWKCDEIRMLNAYGPTECSITATLTAVEGNPVEVSNIGRGFGCLTWIVAADDHNRLMPVGCVGELLIEGPILARAYLNAPEKTAAAFVTGVQWLPKDEVSQARRFYKTGDLVRYRENGEIDYLGRKDHQVKINGLRIELGEIEKKAEECTARVQAAAVDIIESEVNGGSKTLSAFVKLTSGPEDAPSGQLLVMNQDLRESLGAVKAHLESTVPSYMVPSFFFPVSGLPTNVSDKLDRKALRKMSCDLSKQDLITYSLIEQEGSQVQQTDQQQARLSSDETSLKFADIAAQILKVDKADLNLKSSFIALGGDSISAMLLTSRCRAAGLGLTVASLLRSKSLAEALDTLTPLESPKSTMSTRDLQEPGEISPIQKVYFDQMSGPNATPQTSHYNQSWYGKLSRKAESDELIDALQKVVKAHHMLRARFSRRGETWTQRTVPFTLTPPVALIGSREVSSMHEMVAIVNERQSVAMDIENGPVFSADVFGMPDGSQYLCMVAHHLVVDIVSWGVITQEISSLLSGLAELPEEGMTFPTWTRLQAEKGRSEDLAPSKTGAVFDGPIDRSFWGIDDTTSLTHGSYELTSFLIDSDATEFLRGSANDALRTDILDLLLAGLVHSFLTAFPERNRLNVFNEGHGREPWDANIDLTRTVGWFTTIYPVSANRQDGDDVVSLVRQVKDRRRALKNNGWSYFVSRHHNERAMALAQGNDHLMEVEFNWQGASYADGHSDALLNETTLDVIGDQSDNFPAPALFEVNALIHDDGRLEVRFEHQRGLSRQENIRKWISNFEQSLYGMVETLQFCPSTMTLVDVPLLDTDYVGLDYLQNEIIPQVEARCQSKVQSVLPCTPAQDGVLFSQIRLPDTYKTEHAWEIESSKAGLPLDSQRLANAWQKVVHRHAALRAVFVEGVGGVSAHAQLILAEYGGEIVRRKYCTVDEALDGIDEIPPAEYRNLRPPHRLTICEITGGNLVCRLEASHAIIDGFSNEVIEADLNEAYSSGSIDDRGAIYQNFIEYVFSMPVEEKLSYWTGLLDGAKPTLFPETASVKKSKEWAIKTLEVSGDVLTKVHKSCDTYSITTASLMQAAWGLVLQKYTGLESVCFGYFASGRDAAVAQIHSSIGAFMNTLVCRVDISQDATKSEVLQQVHRRALQGMGHQHVSWAAVQHSLGPCGQPLFNTVMSFQKPTGHGGDGEESQDERLMFYDVASVDPTEYAITVNIVAEDDLITVSLGHNPSSVSDESANGILSAFEEALAAFTAASSKLPTSTVVAANGDLANGGHEQGVSGSNSNKESTSTKAVRQPHGKIEHVLQDLVTEVLSLAPSEANMADSFLGVGGDSWLATRLVRQARRAGLELTLFDLFRQPSLAAVARNLERGDVDSPPAGGSESEV